MGATIKLFLVAAGAVALTVLAACGEGAGPLPDPRSGQVVLVVADARTDEPRPVQLADEGLYARHDIALDGALGFTRADLSGMSWRQIRADFPANGPERVFDGPRLSDVLAAAGRAGAGARLTSVDGYQVEIGAGLIARHEPVLAVRADGEPLAIGGLGPAMLVWPRGAHSDLTDMDDDLWPWGVFAVTAIEAR